jgi:hypothetical protein
MDWGTSQLTELLLMVGVLAVIVAVGWVVIRLAIAALLLVAASLGAPRQPQGLGRIATIMEQQVAEPREAAEPASGPDQENDRTA